MVAVFVNSNHFFMEFKVGGDFLDLLYPFAAPDWLTQMLCYQGRNELARRMFAWHETLYHHAIATAVYAETIGRTLGYSGEDLDVLTQGAFFHDVGKIGWPNALVSKRNINDNDYKLIHTHPISGEYFLREYWPEVPVEVCRIVKEHHERLDGSGYPNGLIDKEISTLSAIVSAVEVFTALLEKRPYRKRSFNLHEVLAELENQLFPRKIIDVLAKTKIITMETEAMKRVSI